MFGSCETVLALARLAEKSGQMVSALASERPMNIVTERQSLKDRVSYTLGYARGNTGGEPAPVNNFQFLEERNLDMSYGRNDADRRHIVSVNGRFEVPKLTGLNISGVLRAMTGLPFTIHNTNFDVDRNGILFDPLPGRQLQWNRGRGADGGERRRT